MDVMSMGKSYSKLPIPVTRVLRKLGHDIRDARRRRRIPVALLAERASISRTTLHKVEQGHSGVSLGACVTVLFCLGMSDRLAGVADVRRDVFGVGVDEGGPAPRIRPWRTQTSV